MDFLEDFHNCKSKNKTPHAEIQRGILLTVKMWGVAMINYCVLTFFLKNWFCNCGSVSLAETLFCQITSFCCDKEATWTNEELSVHWKCLQLLRDYEGVSLFVLVTSRWVDWMTNIKKIIISSTSQSCLENFWIDLILIQIPYKLKCICNIHVLAEVTSSLSNGNT